MRMMPNLGDLARAGLGFAVLLGGLVVVGVLLSLEARPADVGVVVSAPADILHWWPIIAFATPFGLGAAGWAIRMGLASKKDLSDHAAAEAQTRREEIRSLGEDIDRRLTQIEATQDGMSNRTLVIETEIQHLPSSEDIGEIKQELAAARARWDGFDRELQSVARSLTRVENHLLKEGASS